MELRMSPQKKTWCGCAPRDLLKVVLTLLVMIHPGTARAATIIRSVVNDTNGGVDDFQMMERGGMNTIVSLSSSGFPLSTAPKGRNGPAVAGATLSFPVVGGGFIGTGATVSIQVQISDGGLLGNSGNLDWQWSLGGQPVGPVHRDFQRLFANLNGINGSGLGEATVIVANAGDSIATYTNFEVGNLPSSADVSGIDADPGGLLPGSILLLGPLEFSLDPGASENFLVTGVNLGLPFATYSDISAGDENYFQLQVGTVPEPSSVFLVLLALGLILHASYFKKRPC